MVKQLNAPPTEKEIYNLLGHKEINSWTQEKVTKWLTEKGWGHFASTFQKHDICRERFFQITLAELVEYLPRTMTTYYERRRLLNEIRLLVPGTTNPTPTTPTNISINTNIYNHNHHSTSSATTRQQEKREGKPHHHHHNYQYNNNNNNERGGIISTGGHPPPPPPSAGSTTSSATSSISPSSSSSTTSASASASTTTTTTNTTLNTIIKSSPTTIKPSSYSPKAAFNKLKSTFQRSSAPMTIPSRVSTPTDKMTTKFWSYQRNNNSPTSYSPPPPPPAPIIQPTKRWTDQRIQITGDKETWYSLNVTHMRDPVAIKQHILQRMGYQVTTPDAYFYYHENGPEPDSPMDPHELMYLCSIADHSANQRILIKLASSFQQLQQQNGNFLYTTPELGKSPTIPPSSTQHSSPIGSPNFRPLCRNKAARGGGRPYTHKNTSVGVQLSDPPCIIEATTRQRTGSVPSLPPPPMTWRRSEPEIDRLVQHVGLWAIAPPVNNKEEPEFWGERPPPEIVFNHMEQYFDSQDLDKEVVVVEPLSRTHTKSIRVVAREASRKLNKQQERKNRGGELMRRKSTKLWGQKVVQVSRQLPCVSEQMRLSNPRKSSSYSSLAATDGPTPDPGEVQWIRGKLIGKGSFGRVYLAFNVGTGEVIAVKQVEVPKTASDLLNQHQHDMVDSLYQEIMTLRDLDHDNIVQYLGYGQEEGVINIFLEYVSGGSVASRLALFGALDELLTKYFTRQICEGLAYLHSKHILHRDIKAANILVEVDGICKISDFGLSKKNDAEAYDQNSRMSLRGSIYWMAPEVVKCEAYSAKVDIWSLGCTVIEMMTGERPWVSLNQIAALYNLGRMNTPTLPDNISKEAQDFLQRCFIIDPCQRPTAVELLDHPFLKINSSFDFKDYVDKGKI